MRKPYPSDLTDEQWAIIEPLIPVNKTGRPRTVPMREVLNAISASTAPAATGTCCRTTCPPGAPSTTTSPSGGTPAPGSGSTTPCAGRFASPLAVTPARGTAGIDSQTVKGAEVGGERGCDGGKKISGVKRHIVVDVLGLLLVAAVSAASADDGTYAPQVLSRLTAEHRARLEVVLGDGKYNNRSLDAYLETSGAAYRSEVIG